MSNDKVYQMSFAKSYPLLVNKAVKKGRTKEEVDKIIRWLTGYSQIETEIYGRNKSRIGQIIIKAIRKLRHPSTIVFVVEGQKGA